MGEEVAAKNFRTISGAERPTISGRDICVSSPPAISSSTWGSALLGLLRAACKRERRVAA
jgi:hypothetical protein